MGMMTMTNAINCSHQSNNRMVKTDGVQAATESCRAVADGNRAAADTKRACTTGMTDVTRAQTSGLANLTTSQGILQIYAVQKACEGIVSRHKTEIIL